jgi:hypothetical protein
MLAHVGIVESTVAGLDGQASTGGHRIARVDCKVDDDLL